VCVWGVSGLGWGIGNISALPEGTDIASRCRYECVMGEGIRGHVSLCFFVGGVDLIVCQGLALLLRSSGWRRRLVAVPGGVVVQPLWSGCLERGVLLVVC